MAPTRSAMLEILFKESHRYREKENVIDHIADRIKFIETGLIDPPQPRDSFKISAIVESARRLELAALHIGFRGRSFTAQLRRLAATVIADSRMPKEIKAVLAKLWSWAPLRASPEISGMQEYRPHEYRR